MARSNTNFLANTGPLTTGLKLTVKQEKAARLLAEGSKQTEAALAVKVTKQTMNRWLKDPLMRRRVEELRLDVVKQTDEVLMHSIPEAAETMVKLATGKLDYLDSKELNPRYQAAKWILETIYKQKLPRTAKPSGQRGGSPMPSCST